MRLKNISDQEVAKKIKEGKHEILPLLFERNLVNSLNLGIKLDISEKKVYLQLANAVVIVWEFFSSKSWIASKHKIDFIIDFLFRKNLQAEFPEFEIKNKYNFPDFENILLSYQNGQKATNGPIINNFKVLSDAEKTSLWLTFFEKKKEEEIAEELGKTEEKIRKTKKKGFVKWVALLHLNQKYPIDKQAFELNIEAFLDYYSGNFSKEKMLEFEKNLSSNKEYAKLYSDFEILVEEIRFFRRNSLVEFITKNASTKLSGNIWGNKISIVSAAFIVLMGVLVWYSKQVKPPHEKTIIPLSDTIKKHEIDTPF